MAPHMQVITDNLDLWTSALLTKSTAGRGSNGRVEAYGIKKLRELILELAVRGKLLPQDSNDEPASILLKRVEKEKARLVRDGKIAKQKPLPPISKDEERFVLPIGWVWARFGNIFELEYGNNLPEAKRTNSGEYPVYGSNGVVGTHDSFCIDKPCIVVGRKGSAGALNLCVYEGCWVTDVAYSVIPPTDLDLKFVFKLFHTIGLDELGKGIKPGLNRNEAYLLTIALPPLAEQHRIVAKVDELMALCDQLEQQQANSIEAHQTLVETLLGTLTTPVRPEPVEGRISSQPFTLRQAQDERLEGNSSGRTEFAEAWTRIANNFDTLFTTEQSIDKLKQTILQLAVMGKLVPQDPDDEPARVLLEKIAKEKERLVKEGVLNKEKPLPEISIEEIPYALPVGWEWERIGRASLTTDYGLSEQTFNDPTGVPVLKMGDIVNGEILLGGQKTVPAHVDGLPGLFLEEGDLLYNRTNSAELVGKTGVYEGGSGAYTFASYLIRIRLAKDFIVPRYLNICMNSPNFRKSEIEPQLKQQCGQANVNGTIMRNMRVPIPSTAEQHRIVAKVDELITLCDALKTRLADAQTTQIHLADTIVEQALV